MTARRLARRPRRGGQSVGAGYGWPSSASALRAATVEEIAEIDKMGLVKAQHVVDGLTAMAGVIDRLAAAGVTMSVPDTEREKPLAGKTYVVSGSVSGYTRTTVSEGIEQLGGRAGGSVSVSTTALVTAETAKAAKAAKLGIPIIDPATFADMLAGGSPPRTSCTGFSNIFVAVTLAVWRHRCANPRSSSSPPWPPNRCTATA